MSGHESIATVTRALQTLLQSGVAADSIVGSGQVTARPPDKARATLTGNQINVFLYRTAIDAAYRNQPPLSVASGESAEPALPLILSYLMTAYGQDDDEVLAHRLLGIAMSVLNDRPILSPELLANAIAGNTLGEQSEHVRIVPHPIPMDEISRLWATFQTGYRISATYDVSVVLIDSSRPVVAAPPVLRRGADDRGPIVTGAPAPPPGTTPARLRTATAPGGRPSVVGGDTLTIVGQNLADVTEFSVSGLRLDQPRTLPPASAEQTVATVVLPTGDDALPAGSYLISAVSTSGTSTFTSAATPFAVRPTIAEASPIRVKIPAGKSQVRLNLTSVPPPALGQSVAIVVSSRVLTATVPDARHPERVRCAFDNAVPGTYALRLRVDAQDSLHVDDADPDAMPSFHVLELT